MPTGFVYPDAWRTFPASVYGTTRSKFAMGITKSVRIAVYPSVHISMLRIWTNVSNNSLAFTATIHNEEAQAQNVSVHPVLSPWGSGHSFDYPQLQAKSVLLPGHGEATVPGSVKWDLGQDSLWWPNKPYRPEYTAVLHVLNVTLQGHGKQLHEFSQRFGFVEWRDDLIPGKWTVNGVAINFISDATPESGMSHYDCYSQSTAFNTIEGAKESWRRYMRLGIHANRIHQSTPTEIMLEAADEVGFVLRPETGIRGGGAHAPEQTFSTELSPQSVRELAHTSRGHPSVAFYSVQNECDISWVPALIDAIVEVDDSTPLVWENSGGCKVRVIHGVKSNAHAVCMDHYSMPKLPQSEQITGEGECAWCSYHGVGLPGEIGTVEQFGQLAWQGRIGGINYISGWDWINYWPNFLSNMSYAQHAWKQPECPDTAQDRVDGVSGWGSPLMHWMQQAFHPYLIVLNETWSNNPSYKQGWPVIVRNGTSGQSLKSHVVVFNDGVHGGDQLWFRLALRWDSSKGPLVVSPSSWKIHIQRGFSAQHNFTITLPDTDVKRDLWMILESIQDDAVLFTEDRIYVLVMPKPKSDGVNDLVTSKVE